MTYVQHQNQQNQQQGPYPGYPGQGQPGQAFAPHQQHQQQHQQQQQPQHRQQQRPPGPGHPPVRPGGPGPGPGPGPNGHPTMRPGNMAPHPGGPARPPTQPRPPHQQQYGPRPGGQGNHAPARPSSAPLGGMATIPPARSPAQQAQYPNQARPPPQQGYPKQALQQQQQQQQHFDQQVPPPNQQDNYNAPGLNELSSQMSNLSVGSNAMDQTASGSYSTMPPQDLAFSQSEVKPAAKTGSRAKRVFAVDHAAPPPSHGQLSGMPPMPMQGSNPTMAHYEGNCNPRFLRMTTYQIPTSEELMEASCIPLGLVIQPLAELRADEAPIDTVDFGEAGPTRCRRCKGYINPYMRFTCGGQRFVCNLCLFENDVEPSYFCNLDMNGHRLDLDQRPELRNGSIEFAVPKEYSSKPPLPAGYVFAIDVSWTAVQSGMLNEAVKAVKQAIWDENGASRLAPGVQIGVMTYDKTVHFYNLSPSLDQAQMLVVPDVGDMFVPLSEGFLVNPETSQTIVESMLEMIPHLFAENKTTEPVIGAAVQAVRMALENRGGKLILFQTALPTFGPGALRQRDEARLHGTDKERALYTPQDSFYQKLAESCVQVGLSIDLFLFPNAYIDVATVGTLASVTGGETFLYPNFSADKDSERFVGTLARLVSRTFGFNALLRVRCSTGLTTTEHVGNFFMKNGTDVELAGLDSERALGVLIKHEGGKLDEKAEASFQVALLYTTASGQRRVRVHNFSVPITGQMSQMFREADMDTTVNFLARAVAQHALCKPLKEVRDVLTDRCVRVLSAYRRHCASSTAAGQLILPESYKLFPLYTLTMLKSKMIRAGGDINSDLRVQQMRMVQSMGVSESIAFFYPRLFAVSCLAGHVGVVDHHHPAGRVTLPGLVRTSYSRLDPAGVYVLENGQRMFLWVGREVAQEKLLELFGVMTLEEVDATVHHIPELSNDYNSRVRTVLQTIQQQRGKYLGLRVVRQGLDATEAEFAFELVEDQNNENMSYVDYLCTVHRMIQTDVTTGHN
ncbi:COPII coat Sec23p-Sfb3p heterodimer component [Podila minutissima]|uniref:COPII coat Sec23p-Sfb3p heterodimer component n=1 Tax=Podila minutissima TaxID=64525 RepID=A0A9P5SN35_9FUNG|nr:COPII coat Sec23p-Sfb3p heterodimer component [Podila minutissima]